MISVLPIVVLFIFSFTVDRLVVDVISMYMCFFSTNTSHKLQFLQNRAINILLILSILHNSLYFNLSLCTTSHTFIYTLYSPLIKGFCATLNRTNNNSQFYNRLYYLFIKQLYRYLNKLCIIFTLQIYTLRFINILTICYITLYLITCVVVIN